MPGFAAIKKGGIWGFDLIIEILLTNLN